MMKRILALLILSVLLLSSCGGETEGPMLSTDESTTVAENNVMDTTAHETEPTYEAPESFRILAIGNSFTVDTFEYLYAIADSYGAKNIYIGNAAIGGAGLTKHVECLRGDLANYDYYINHNGKTTATQGHTLKSCLTAQNWDMIVLIGVSGLVGVEQQYVVLPELIDYVNQHKTNPDAPLVWLVSWAYQADSDHPSFALYYEKNQMKMYEMGIAAAKKCVEPLSEIAQIIPLSTTFQNLRTSFIGDTLTRDGHHANLTTGRYALALTFYCAVTGADPYACPYRLKDDVTEGSRVFDAIAEAVANALKEPYAVTPATVTK